MGRMHRQEGREVMKYSKEITGEICKYLEQGMTLKDTAALTGIAQETFYQWLKKPEFSEAVKKAEMKCKQRNIALIQKAAITTWQAGAWWLERRHSDEYALKSLLLHAGSDGEPLTLKLVRFGNDKHWTKEVPKELTHGNGNGNHAPA